MCSRVRELPKCDDVIVKAVYGDSYLSCELKTHYVSLANEKKDWPWKNVMGQLQTELWRESQHQESVEKELVQSRPHVGEEKALLGILV